MNDQAIENYIIPKITKRQWLTSILAIITAMTALMGVDLYLPAMTDMATHFNTTKNHLQLTITIYLISIAMAAFFYGPLSDKIGRKPTLIIGMITGLVGCLIIIFSSNINMVIIGRLIQGLGASSGICIATSILMDVVPNTKQRAIMSSYLSMVIALSPLTAPTIGGYLTQSFGWRACFELLATLFGLLASIYIIFFKETIKTKNPNAIKPKHFINNYTVLIKNRVFLSMCLCAGIVLSLVISYANIAPFLFMGTFKLSPIDFGWITLIVGLSNLIGKYSNKFFIKKLTVLKTMQIGMSLGVAGGIWLIISSLFNFNNPITVLIGVFISQLSIGLIAANAPVIALTPFQNIAGSASAMYRGGQQTVSFMVSAILTALPWHNTYTLAVSFIVLGFIGVILLKSINQNNNIG